MKQDLCFFNLKYILPPVVVAAATLRAAMSSPALLLCRSFTLAVVLSFCCLLHMWKCRNAAIYLYGLCYFWPVVAASILHAAKSVQAGSTLLLHTQTHTYMHTYIRIHY